MIADFTHAVPHWTQWHHEPWADLLKLACTLNEQYVLAVFPDTKVQGPQIVADDLVVLRYVLRWEPVDEFNGVRTLEIRAHLMPLELRLGLEYVTQRLDPDGDPWPLGCPVGWSPHQTPGDLPRHVRRPRQPKSPDRLALPISHVLRLGADDK